MGIPLGRFDLGVAKDAGWEVAHVAIPSQTDMFAVLSETRRNLMREVMTEPKTINQLVEVLRRDRTAITRDVGQLEELGLLVCKRQSNPGHGIQKIVRSIAPKIELVATLA